MDSTFHEAKNRFKGRKPKTLPHPKTKFQRQLMRNPYAQALAAPARKCAVTSVVLPKTFLQGYGLMSNPETGEPWWVPRNLDRKEPPTRSDDADFLADETYLADNEEAMTAQDEPASEAEPRQEDKKNTIVTEGPASYLIAHQNLLREFVEKRSPYRQKYQSLLRAGSTWAERLGRLVNKAFWREDMDSFQAEVMRRRIVEGMLETASKVEKDKGKYLIRCETWDDAKEHKHRGCLLYLGQPELEADVATNSPNAPESLPRLSTMVIDGVRYGGKLAVHDLRALLGDEHLAHLRKESSLLRSGSLFLLGRQRTVELQMMLWQLQGYLANE
ncbi:hypothetical protein B0H63DRAFT_454305 [Podospora didyma]|uniref:Esterase-like protein n=1 Tax=Podospora didyma TaxID=330526 RepID=A0AAE0N442_9PEZI|nr:hypothetical protein B0H63DRAFT_454305 [Podospora didyma]